MHFGGHQKARGLAIAMAALGLFCSGSTVRAAEPAAKPAANAAAQQETKAVPTGFLLKTIKQGDQETRYVLYVPPDYDAAKAWPTILFLHGAGECGHDGFKPVAVGIGSAVMLDSEHWPFLILIPQKPDVRDSWAQHDALLMAMLDATKRDYNVDTTRLYLTGLSQGGYGTWAIGARHPDLFAAIAPICGGGNTSDAAAYKNLPVWAFHGDADPVVPPKNSQEMVDAVKAAGGDAKLTLYPGVGHDSWDKAYREAGLYDWFLKYRRESK